MDLPVGMQAENRAIVSNVVRCQVSTEGNLKAEDGQPETYKKAVGEAP